MQLAGRLRFCFACVCNSDLSQSLWQADHPVWCLFLSFFSLGMLLERASGFPRGHAAVSGQLWCPRKSSDYLFEYIADSCQGPAQIRTKKGSPRFCQQQQQQDGQLGCGVVGLASPDPIPVRGQRLCQHRAAWAWAAAATPKGGPAHARR